MVPFVRIIVKLFGCKFDLLFIKTYFRYYNSLQPNPAGGFEVRNRQKTNFQPFFDKFLIIKKDKKRPFV